MAGYKRCVPIHSVHHPTPRRLTHLRNFTARLPQYKLDRRPFMAPDAELLKKLAIQTTVGHFLTVPFASYLVYPLLIW